MTEEMLHNFKMMKTKVGPGPHVDEFFKIVFIDAAFNKKQNFAAFVIEFRTQVQQHLLEKQLKEHGARQVDSLTFPAGDSNASAARALRYIMKMGIKNNSRYQQGECSPHLLARINGCCSTCKRPWGDVCESSLVEEDKPKKSKISNMELGLSTEELYDDKFVQTLLDITKNEQQSEQDFIKAEKESRQAFSGVVRQRTFGFVYGAWNPCFADLVKFGATWKESPYIRIAGLSGSNVPRKFELIACIPSLDPFKLEKQIHAFMKDKRILKDGVPTEFFRISREEASAYFTTLIEM